jgi:hypothetical protein
MVKICMENKIISSIGGGLKFLQNRENMHENCTYISSKGGFMNSSKSTLPPAYEPVTDRLNKINER